MADGTCKEQGCEGAVIARGWCTRHYQRWLKHGSPTGGQAGTRRALPRSASLEDRFWLRVNKNGPVSTRRPGLSPCWVWTGGKNQRDYGQFHIGKKLYLVHRLAYTWLVRPIPDDLTIDHLCFNTLCVNPDHMEPVPNRVNNSRGNSITARNARKTHCSKGHPYDEANTYWPPQGGRKCRECQRRHARAAHARKRAASSTTALRAA